MSQKVSLCLALLLFGLPAVRAEADRDLAARLDAVVHRPEYQQGRWGLLVVDADTGKALYRYQADQPFVPASTMKLYYAAATLAALGPDYRFRTPVYRRGKVVDGRLQGDLILVASGDPTLGGRNQRDGHMAYTSDDHTYANASGTASELTDTDPLTGLESLARQVSDAGIRRVEGDVLIDARLFAQTVNNGNGPDWISPIAVNDNVVDVLVTPSERVGDLASVRLRPASSFLHADNQVVTVSPGHATWISVQSPAAQRFVVRGQIPVGASPTLRFYPVQAPAAFARALFLDCLHRAGVEVNASPTEAPRADLPEKDSYDEADRVALFTSLPFSELLKVTLKTSSNVYANTFPLLLAARHGRRSMAEGMRLLREELDRMGVASDDISIATASGGTRDDYLTPRAVVQLLQAEARRPEYPVFLDALPVLGVDGTLSDMVPSDSPVRGKARAKTGTYFLPGSYTQYGNLRAKGLAGTLTTATGRTLFFAFFINDVPLPPGVPPEREGRTLGHLCEILYRYGP